MDARTFAVRPPLMLSSTGRLLLRRLAVAASCALVGLAAWLLVRRLSGAMLRPLPPGALLLMGASLAAANVALRTAWQAALGGDGRLQPARQRWIVAAAPAAAAVAVIAAVAIPGSAYWAVALAGLLLVVEEAACIAWLAGHGPRRTSVQDSLVAIAAPAGAMTTPAVRPEYASDAADVPTEPPVGATDQASPLTSPAAIRERPFAAALAENVSQQLTRATDEEGVDMLMGTLRASFAPRQRTGRIHVAFCPPFEHVPEVAVEAVAGPEVTVKVGALLAYGVRLDLRLSRLAPSPQEVVLELFVREKAPAEPHG